MLGIIHHWWLPVISAIFWWGMLIALMVCWAAQGHPIPSWVDTPHQTILYISDVAASNLQPIFISLAGAQGLFFVLGLASERYLRHSGRLLPSQRRREKWTSGLAIFFAIIGQLGILMVSIFNTKVFPEVHSSMLAVFIVFVGVSALCSIVEYFYLDKSYPDYPALAWSTWFKAVWFVVELGIAISFVSVKSKYINASAILEWTISFLYPLYSLNIAYDLWPAHNTKRGQHLKYNDPASYNVADVYPVPEQNQTVDKEWNSAHDGSSEGYDNQRPPYNAAYAQV